MAPKKQSPRDEPVTPPTDDDLLQAGREAMFRRAKRQGRGGYFIEEAEDGVSMSDALDLFVAPLRDEAMSFRQYKTLLALGQAAWNAGLAPADQRQRLIDLACATIGRGAPRKNGQILQYLLLRKGAVFADFTRRMVDFQLTQNGQEWYLSVLSSPKGKPVDEDSDAG